MRRQYFENQSEIEQWLQLNVNRKSENAGVKNAGPKLQGWNIQDRPSIS